MNNEAKQEFFQLLDKYKEELWNSIRCADGRWLTMHASSNLYDYITERTGSLHQIKIAFECDPENNHSPQKKQ